MLRSHAKETKDCRVTEWRVALKSFSLGSTSDRRTAAAGQVASTCRIVIISDRRCKRVVTVLSMLNLLYAKQDELREGQRPISKLVPASDMLVVRLW